MFLAFVALGATLLIMLGRFVSPYSTRRPVRTWGLEDYGTHLMRGLGVFFSAGERNAYRMDRMHEEAKRRPDRDPEGLDIVQGPWTGDEEERRPDPPPTPDPDNDDPRTPR